MTRILVVFAVLLVAAAGSPATTEAQPATPRNPTAPADFVVLSDIDSTILHDIRYATPHNFTGEPVAGYTEPLCILTRAAADALSRAQRLLLTQGYSLKVYDCYRPQRAVDYFVSWAQDIPDQRMKAEFYPRVDKTTLFADGYIADKSGHSRGSTVDLTVVRLPAATTAPYVVGQPLVDCAAPQPVRFPDNSIDMGTGFDCFDTLSHTFDPRVQGAQLSNRLLLKDALEAQGFEFYDSEWWHFTLADEPYPDTFFDVPVDRAAVHPR
ncbi:M15 family metallopeptidase [Mycolicibacterium sp. 018/SC-01/001]|uniref:M15 family metallopeptidase n=1 Tax=Mycolicibacterium sp. 018/SC-01/001 TaxID=2592069 RepID=UPI00117C7BD6|nr:M15 family metallopeptidase [Mycolicibacterium sp. 018/SC-01/001]TRW78502.1 M15 family metallopeptidase [Mycolicibacterium sp. 018/SC-01/001]